MKKVTIYRTVIRFEILSPEPLEDEVCYNLEAIKEMCEDGDCSGQSLDREVWNEKLSGKTAVDIIKEQGSDPGFFGMDDNGNELED